MATASWVRVTAPRSPVNFMARNVYAAAECATSSASFSSAFDAGARPLIRCGGGDGALGRGSSRLGHARTPHQCGRRGRQSGGWGGSVAGGESDFRSSASIGSSRSWPCLRARRKSGGDGGATRQLQEGDEQLDEDMRLGLNEISTEALKAMLSEDDKIVEELREKVEDIEGYLTRLEQFDAAKFMLVVKGLLDHEVVPATDELKGAYKAALKRITSVIEDSGWVLKREGADLGGVEMVDDELMPPVLNSQY